MGITMVLLNNETIETRETNLNVKDSFGDPATKGIKEEEEHRHPGLSFHIEIQMLWIPWLEKQQLKLRKRSIWKKDNAFPAVV